VVGLGCALALACSREAPPRIDMSTPQAAQRSMTEVRRSLSDAERVRFTAAASLLAQHEQAVGAGDAEAALQRALGGRTADEVIAAAAALPTPVRRATPRGAAAAE
jgi:hypothetical protein